MKQQTYQLNNLTNNFKKMEKDKKKAPLKTLQCIIQLNNGIGFDEILIRSGFQAYSKKNELESNKTEQNYRVFFKYMMENLNEIESNYLRDTNDAKLIEQAVANQSEYNFLLNKNSVSKFIRDEAIHYQKVMEKLLETINEVEQQKGIKTSKMHTFLMDLFTSKHIMIFQNGEEYLKRSIAEIQVDVGHHLLQYAKKCKQMTQEQAKEEYFISEQEILDFLTFWLREEPKLFVLYARTQERLHQESKLIANQSHLTAIVHPSRMTSQEIVKKVEEIELVKQDLPQEISKSQLIQKVDQIVTPTSSKDINNDKMTLPIKNESNEIKQQQQQNFEMVVQKPKKEISKEDMLKREMKSLFEFGCKRKYKLNKNTTFQDILEESRTMSLQKFVFFCNYFELNEFFTRELLTEHFKMFALNLRMIDFPRFEKVIGKMIKFDERVIDNLLKKNNFDEKHKKYHINKNKKSQQKLSSYKFMLHPINGKDVSTIQKQLTFRKLQKMIIRQQKQKLALNRREELEKAPAKMTSRVIPSFSSSKISAVELQPIRDMAFNPEKLISNGENDKLWEAYEAKIWNRDQRRHGTLESILTKRIERGNIVINKLNSQRSFIYDQ